MRAIVLQDEAEIFVSIDPPSVVRRAELVTPHSMSWLEIKVTAIGGTIATLWGFHTSPRSKRGHGYGTKLMMTVITQLRREGYQIIYLYVLEDNTAALRLYQKLGFTFKVHWEGELEGTLRL